jgi:DNA-binding transcriptional regulator LsrR (DeoR family)
LVKLAAAQLRVDGLSQPSISKTLKISQSLVCKLLAEAASEKEKILIDRPYLNLSACRPQDMAEARNRYLGGDVDLAKSLAAGRDTDNFLRIANLPDDRAVFAQSAARYISDLLHQSTCVGLMYGRTLSMVVEVICQSRPKNAPPMDRLTCIPLSGTPVYLINVRESIYTSSRLAGDLQEALNKPDISQPSLEGVPAYIPRLCFPRSQKPLDEQNGQDGQPTVLTVPGFVARMPGFMDIFDREHDSDRSPYNITKVDTLITGVGVIDARQPPVKDRFTTGAFIRERILAERADDVTVDSLNRICMGDIGGILVPERDCGPDDRNFVNDLNHGWTGIKEHDLTAIAGRAREHGPPGVIVISMGDPSSPDISKAKARIIREVVRLGYANHVICSNAIARHLRG